MIYRGFYIRAPEHLNGIYVAWAGSSKRRANSSLYIREDLALRTTFDSGTMDGCWASEQEAKAAVDNFHAHGPDRNIFTEEFLNQMHCSNSNTEEP